MRSEQMNLIQNQIKFIKNDRDKSFYHHLINSLEGCKRFSFSVAFISDSGLQLIIKEIKEAIKRGVEGRILTTNYEYGTSPTALKMLLQLDEIDSRIYDALPSGIRKFHTKGYIFEYDTYFKVFIGSSNMTQYALKSNHEWNIAYLNKDDQTMNEVLSAYEELFNHEQSIKLTQSFIDTYEKGFLSRKQLSNNKEELYQKIVEFIKDNPASDFFMQLANMFEVDEEALLNSIEREELVEEFRPNEMQELALEGLNNIRAAGGKKALIIAATGTGKTYLAAFDVANTKPKKMLFVVHREKILSDALNTFKQIIKDKRFGIYTGTQKGIEADYLFASIQTISRIENLRQFRKDEFDYIVIDEAHRSAADSYQKLIEYFTPEFQLGMTATPERTDSKSIFELYDNQIAVEIRLRDALEKNLVVPFHYFGIEDITTDLSDINLSDEAELIKRLNIKRRVDLIIENIDLLKHSGHKTKALGFCVNKEHARYMANEFNLRGYVSAYLTSESSNEERKYAIERLESDRDPLSYLFTVEIFNEGIDIPSVNLVLMLRPTQSAIIFTQQLGRGLRLHKDKEYLTVLDFIGNHQKSFLIPIALSGEKSYDKDDLIIATQNDFFDIPGDTFINLERIPKNRILKQLEEVNFNQMAFLKESYQDVRKGYGSYVMITSFPFDGFDPIRFIRKEKSYLEFIDKVENTADFDSITSDINQIGRIRFIDGLLPLSRIDEFSILDYLIEHKSATFDELFNHNKRFINHPIREVFSHAIQLLDKSFMSVIEKEKYPALIQVSKNVVRLDSQFESSLSNDLYKQMVKSTISYGLTRYHHEFGREVDPYPHIRLYHPYPKSNVFTQALYDKNILGSLISGVFKWRKEYFLSVNLIKSNVKEELMFKDHFHDQKHFQWQSMNRTTQMSEDGQNMIEHVKRGFNLHLLVRKSALNGGLRSGYSENFIYLGKVKVLSYEGNNPITFQFELENEVPFDLYKKLTLKIEKE